MSTFFAAFSITLLAGLSTIIGSLFILFVNRNNDKFLAFGMGLSAGAMLYLSFMEILPEAKEALTEAYSSDIGHLATLLFFVGIGIMALLGKLTHHSHQEIHHVPHKYESDCVCATQKGMLRTGRALAIAIALHNLPEGLATFSTAMHDMELGILIAVAVAIHNIPMGIAIATPIYTATQSRKKAFLTTFCVGLVEPLGAVIGMVFLLPLMSPVVGATLFAVVAGILVYISTIDLIPTSRENGHTRLAGSGLIFGMALMALSMMFLNHSH